MSKTTKLSQGSKEKEHASQYAQNGWSVSTHAVTATAKAHNRPKVKIVAATGDKFNTYKTRIT